MSTISLPCQVHNTLEGPIAICDVCRKKDMDDLLLTKLPDVLDAAQKAHKIRNLLQAMRRDGLIHRTGPKATAIWRLGAGQVAGQS